MSGKVVLKKKRSLIRSPETDQIVLTCPVGGETELVRELRGLGFSAPTPEGAAVRVSGEISSVTVLNRQIRTASRVLVPLIRFDATDFDTVYSKTNEYHWEQLISPDHSFMIVANSRSTTMPDHRFLAMRVKDAIVDRQRERHGGRRSSIDKNRPDLIITVFADTKSVEIGIDSTGEPLHQRGYRTEAGEAPIRETVAAQMVLASSFSTSPRQALLDPFCGSGTIVIEAALLRQGRGPGTLGRRFAYQRWPWWSKSGDDSVQTPRFPHSSAQPSCIGTDSDPRVIEIARRNAERAGVADLVQFEVLDFRDSMRRWIPKLTEQNGGTEGVVVTNPPYGVRLRPEALSVLYSDFGNALRDSAPGWEAIVIAAEDAPYRAIKLRPESNASSHNGSISCRLLRYRVFGTRRRKGTD